MAIGPFADAQPCCKAVLVVCTEVNAPEETAVRRFRGRGRKTAEAAMHPRQEIRARSEGDVVRTVESGEDSSRGTAEGAMARNVAGERRRDDE